MTDNSSAGLPTVILPVLNGGERFRQCLEALRHQTAEHRLVVIDNGSSDDSARAASEVGATVVHESRRSSYAARNRGLGEATSDIVAFVDADCVPDPDWLEHGVRALRERDWHLCAGRVIQEPGRSAAGRYDSQFYLQQEDAVRSGYGATANLFVRVSVFSDVGGFAHLKSGGDMDFGMRATAAGYRIGYEPAAVVRHPPRQTLLGVLRKSWRISVGHGQLVARGRLPLRKEIDWRRLKPPLRVLRTRDPGVIAVDFAWRVVAYIGRIAGFVSESVKGEGRGDGASGSTA